MPLLNTKIRDNQEKERVGLFLCKHCRTIEEIPDYTPDEADHDPRLHHLIATHLRRHPSLEWRREGDPLLTDWCSLGSVPQSAWSDTHLRTQIKAKIMEGENTGLGEDAYAVRDTFREDAGNCYNQHKRPTFKGVKCLDYRDSTKEIKPDTRALRKEAGIPSYDETKMRRVFLCDYCPYHQDVMTNRIHG